MTTQLGLFDADFSDLHDADLGPVVPPRLVLTGRVAPPPPRLVIKRRGIPVRTKMFALLVLMVVFWALGHYVFSQLLTVQASAPIPPTISTPTTRGAATSSASQTAYPIGSGAQRTSGFTVPVSAERVRIVFAQPVGGALHE